MAWRITISLPKFNFFLIASFALAILAVFHKRFPRASSHGSARPMGISHQQQKPARETQEKAAHRSLAYRENMPPASGTPDGTS